MPANPQPNLVYDCTLQNMRRVAKEACKIDISHSVKGTGREYLATLNKFVDPDLQDLNLIRQSGGLWKHVHVSLMCFISPDTLDTIFLSWEGLRVTALDSSEQWDLYLLSGTLDVWRDVVIRGSNKRNSPVDLVVFNQIEKHLESKGYGFIFEGVRRQKDQTGRLHYLE